MGLSTSNKRLLLIALFTTLLTTTNPIKVAAQLYSIQTDAIGLLTGTFNAGASMAVSERYSLHIHSEYNPWTFSGNKKTKFVTIQPGMRYWLGEAYGYGWFYGLNAIYSNFNVSKIFVGKHRYAGNAFGGGISIGFNFPITRRINMEVELGGGIVYSKSTKYEGFSCGKKLMKEKKTSIIPTKIAMSIVYLF